MAETLRFGRLCTLCALAVMLGAMHSAKVVAQAPGSNVVKSNDPTASLVERSAPAKDVVVAVVEGRRITLNDVDDKASLQIYTLEQKIYNLRLKTLEDLITKICLEGEAKRRGITVDELKSLLAQNAPVVEDAEVDKVYIMNASQFSNIGEDEAKQRIRMDLQQRARLSSYQAAVRTLRNKFNVEVTLPQPIAPVVSVNSSGPIRGTINAPVTIIEFSDFQCPFCKRAATALKELLEDKKGTVKLVFKQYPLAGHQYAFGAAQAALCAAQQNKFWEYHDLLFEHSTDLSVKALKEYAAAAHMDADKFNQCFDTGDTQAAVMKDMQDGIRAGITATPTFLINGTVVQGIRSLEDFKALVDSARRTTDSGGASDSTGSVAKH
jgi:protein-disulfide isomerase